MVETSWVNPELSLAAQLHQEMDRRRAAHASRHELYELADKLLLDWYQHEAVISAAARHIASLEIKLALAESGPAKPEPEPHHMQWARELLGKP